MESRGLRGYIVILLSFFGSLTVLPTMNPLGIAYFTAAYIHPPGRFLLFLVTILGMAVTLPMQTFIKYTAIIAGIILVIAIVELRHKPIEKRQTIKILMAFVWASAAGYAMAGVALDYRGILAASALGLLESSLTGIGFILFEGMIGWFLNTDMGRHQRQALSEDDFSKTQMKEMALSMKQLAKTVGVEVSGQALETKMDCEEVLECVAMDVCGKCGQKENCWSQDPEEFYTDTMHMIQHFFDEGSLGRGELPLSFRRRCVNVDRFLKGTTTVLEMASLNRQWKNQVVESQMAVAGQFGDFANLMMDLSREAPKTPESVNKMLKNALESQCKTLRIRRLSKKSEHKHTQQKVVYIEAKTGWGHLVAVKDVASILGTELGCVMLPKINQRLLIGRRYGIYKFIEESHYKLIYGEACRQKVDETVSGDAFSLRTLTSGEAMICIADGMGSGSGARNVSEKALRLLEQLLDAGFAVETALRLLNNAMSLHMGTPIVSTIDVCLIDLYSGQCQCLKAGGVTTYIKRGTQVECVSAPSLPAGAVVERNYEVIQRSLLDEIWSL